MTPETRQELNRLLTLWSGARGELEKRQVALAGVPLLLRRVEEASPTELAGIAKKAAFLPADCLTVVRGAILLRLELLDLRLAKDAGEVWAAKAAVTAPCPESVEK